MIPLVSIAAAVDRVLRNAPAGLLLACRNTWLAVAVQHRRTTEMNGPNGIVDERLVPTCCRDRSLAAHSLTAGSRRFHFGAVAYLAIWLSGCTSFQEYFQNGFKVGPNYCRPDAPVAGHWIDSADQRVQSETADISQWWGVFNDPVLSSLMESAYQQNLPLREAGFRVLQARAQRGYAIGEFFPQSQTASGGFTRTAVSENVANRVATPQRWFDTWTGGFGLAWELDFWGRFRRAIESATAELDASVENYDAVLVTLLGDIGREYVEIRTRDEQLKMARASLAVFERLLTIAEARYQADANNKIPYDMARANVAQAQALVAELEIFRRHAEIRLCVLLGIPPQDLAQVLGEGQIPVPPPGVVVGIPADLLRRRPDVRMAERTAAAQSARIGIAESDFYPAISIIGTIGVGSQNLSDLFTYESFRGTIGPAFNWQILNYGRILNNVRAQDAHFNELITKYQQTVLEANGEVEQELIRFLKQQVRAKALADGADAWRDSLTLVTAQFEADKIDFVPVAFAQQNLLVQQNEAIFSQGLLVRALIDVYRALGGGWEIRLNSGEGTIATLTPEAAPLPMPMPVEPVPAPVQDESNP
jgi:NodT family efflux transporter outer membrane factor (OMF) lipoprotein